LDADGAEVAEGGVFILNGNGENGAANGDAVVLVNTANAGEETGADIDDLSTFEMAIYIVGGGTGVTWEMTEDVLAEDDTP
jgi:hypothetical protein